MNKENKIYYKAVRKIDDKLYSFSAYGKAKVEYKVNEYVQAPEWLRKKDYHLLVFDNLKDCINFLKPMEHVDKIYTCKIKGKIEKLPAILNFYYLSHSSMVRARIFYTEEGKIRTDILCTWPIGTIMAKKVMLLEEVK